MPKRLAARNGGRWGLAALAAILLLGLGLRVGEAWDGRAPVYDAAAYAAIARNLDQGHGFTVGATATQPSDDYSPGLPLFVAGLYKVAGGVHERLARLVLALIGTLAVLFAYLLGRRLGGAVAGLIAALAVAIYPATIEYTGMLMTEPLAATLLIGAVLAVLWAADDILLRRWWLPGLTLGALALVRPEYLPVGFLLALLVFVRQRFYDGWRQALLAAVVVALGIVVVVAPWTFRNAVALHRFVPISTGGGQVLYAGTYLPSDGDPEKVGAAVVGEHPELYGPDAVRELRLEQILARLAERVHPGLEPDQALSRMGKGQLEADVTDQTGEYLEFVASKIGRIWSHGPRAVMREPVWEALHWALLGLGLLGLAVLAWRRRWEALLVGAVFLAITLITALVAVASPRRVLVMVPLLAACAGFGSAWLVAGARAITRRERPDERIA